MTDVYIKIRKLRKQIKLLNNKYPNINNGACGTFSYYISKVLDKYDIKHDIVYSKEEITPPDAYRCDIKFEHIMIKLQTGYLDNNTLYLLFIDEREEYFFLDKPKLKEMLMDKKLWNDQFKSNHSELARDILKIQL